MKAFVIFCLCIGNALGQFAVNYVDAAGTGFFSTESRAPIGGNTGTTLGEQRRIAFERAIEIWSDFLNPAGPIVIDASFASLECSIFGVILAGANPVTAFDDFPEAPESNTLYVGALANHLAGRDLEPTASEIQVQVNTAVDGDPNCNGGAGFYYGLDQPTAPMAPVDFLRLILHELAHGLGFTPLVDFTTGAPILGIPTPYLKNLHYLDTNQSWADLTNAQRLAASNAGPLTVWAGRNTELGSSSQITGGINLIEIIPDQGSDVLTAIVAQFSPAVPAAGVTGEVVLVDDGVDPRSDACELPLVNAAAISGRIALIDRGGCDFGDKAERAQAAGAIAVIIANNVPDRIITLGGGGNVSIPVLSVTQRTGQTLRNLASGVTVTISNSSTSGTSRGRPLMETPVTFALGSSVSHFTLENSPNLLMEPEVGSVSNHPDLALTVMRDMGWSVQDVPFPNLDFELWSQIRGLSPGGALDDADGDGFSNFTEYAFGVDADEFQSQPLAPRLTDMNGTSVMLDYARNNQVVDVNYRVIELDDLPDAMPQILGEGVLNSEDGETSRYQLNLGQPSSERAFFQIEATKID